MFCFLFHVCTYMNTPHDDHFYLVHIQWTYFMIETLDKFSNNTRPSNSYIYICIVFTLLNVFPVKNGTKNSNNKALSEKNVSKIIWLHQFNRENRMAVYLFTSFTHFSFRLGNSLYTVKESFIIYEWYLTIKFFCFVQNIRLSNVRET